MKRRRQARPINPASIPRELAWVQMGTETEPSSWVSTWFPDKQSHRLKEEQGCTKAGVSQGVWWKKQARSFPQREKQRLNIYANLTFFRCSFCFSLNSSIFLASSLRVWASWMWHCATLSTSAKKIKKKSHKNKIYICLNWNIQNHTKLIYEIPEQVVKLTYFTWSPMFISPFHVPRLALATETKANKSLA